MKPQFGQKCACSADVPLGTAGGVPATAGGGPGTTTAGGVVTCGATAGREVCLNLWPVFVKEQRLIGSYGRTRADLEATLEWAAHKRIRPVIHETFPLDRVPDAFAALRERRALGKILVMP